MHNSHRETLPPIMDMGGAKALAAYLSDEDANPPVRARAATNGPSHKAVVHVTFGDPREQTKSTRGGETKNYTPERPAPYTIS